MHELCLITVPYSHLHTPSLAVALLTATTRQAGLRTEHLDIRFRFAERIGLKRYVQMCIAPAAFLMGELTFAAAAFPDFEPDYAAVLGARIGGTSPSINLRGVFGDEEIIPILDEIRCQAATFLDNEAERVLALEPRIVGCSSSCEQHCASLALLRRIKERKPDVVTMMGGGNCDGSMGAATARAFPWIDYVVSGEADLMLAPLCRLILEHNGQVPASNLPAGVFDGRHLPTAGPIAGCQDGNTVADLDLLPDPDYSGYFKALSEYEEQQRIFPALQLESSRGCSWRQKKNGGCTFCGQNGQRQSFRSKSPDRIRSELMRVQDRYLGRAQVTVMADTIIPRAYFSNLLPDLGSEQTIFWMTDANLGERQIEQLAAARARVILPGIESFHDGALRLMNKPSSAIGNVAMLKHARQHGVLVQWQFLYGIPGEQAEWYDEMAAWLPLVSHLQPPLGMSVLRYDRFSTYFQDQQAHGLSLVPGAMYEVVYPLQGQDLVDLAYFFRDETETRSVTTRSPGVAAVLDCLQRWQRLFLQSTLSASDDGATIQVTDTRPCAVVGQHTLHGATCAVLRSCQSPRTEQGLVRSLAGRESSPLPPVETRQAIAELVEQRLLLRLNGKLLALPLREPVQPMLKKREFLWGYHIDGRLL